MKLKLISEQPIPWNRFIGKKQIGCLGSLSGEFTIQPLCEPAGYHSLTLKGLLLFPGRNVITISTESETKEFQQPDYYFIFLLPIHPQDKGKSFLLPPLQPCAHGFDGFFAGGEQGPHKLEHMGIASVVAGFYFHMGLFQLLSQGFAVLE